MYMESQESEIESKKMEDQSDKQVIGIRRKQTAEGLDALNIDSGDGLKTSEEIKCYDPLANPMDNPLQNKQGVGTAGYDYSDCCKDPNCE